MKCNNDEKFYKITNDKENHNNFQYSDGLNLLDNKFEPNGSCVKGGLYFSSHTHIHKFFSYGCYIREVEFPDRDDFQIVLDPAGDKYRANMIILGPRYSLLDETTYQKFNLPIPSTDELVKKACKYGFTDFVLKISKENLFDIGSSHNIHIDEYMKIASDNCKINVLNLFKTITDNKFSCHKDIILFASSNNHIDVLEWWKKSGKKLIYDCDAMGNASKNRHLVVLDWWLSSGLEPKYDTQPINHASLYKHFDILDWWKASGLNIKNDTFVIEEAAWFQYFNVLNWWKDSGLEVNYGNECINNASRKGHIDMLNWWKNSGLELKYDNYSIIDVSMETLNWWEKSGLELIYDCECMHHASANGYIDVLNWWKDSGLELKYDCQAINKIPICSELMNLNTNTLNWWKSSGLELRYNCQFINNAIIYNNILVLIWWKESGLELRYDCQSIYMVVIRGNRNMINWWKNSGLELKYDNETRNKMLKPPHDTFFRLLFGLELDS